MCLIALALDRHPRYPLVIASNRDEFLHRPAAALDWWQNAPDTVPLLGGRDLQAGGTWMALSARGRLAMLTNVRDLPRHKPVAPSRGAIVPAWLESREPVADFWRVTAAQGHNPFNLLAADLTAGHWWWADDRAKAPRALDRGLYGLSNAELDTPWPKVDRLKRALAHALTRAASPAALETMLFAALADRLLPHDDALPDTGVGLERERWLAPAFIRTPDARYGTRCSTVLIAERHADGVSARVVERQFDDEGRALSQQGVRLEHWPLSPGVLPRVAAEPISAA
jgi:uncharacterized protein with NRDE domain